MSRVLPVLSRTGGAPRVESCFCYLATNGSCLPPYAAQPRHCSRSGVRGFFHRRRHLADSTWSIPKSQQSRLRLDDANRWLHYDALASSLVSDYRWGWNCAVLGWWIDNGHRNGSGSHGTETAAWYKLVHLEEQSIHPAMPRTRCGFPRHIHSDLLHLHLRHRQRCPGGHLLLPHIAHQRIVTFRQDYPGASGWSIRPLQSLSLLDAVIGSDRFLLAGRYSFR